MHSLILTKYISVAVEFCNLLYSRGLIGVKSLLHLLPNNCMHYHLTFLTTCNICYAFLWLLPYGYCPMDIALWLLPYSYCHMVIVLWLLSYGYCPMVIALWLLSYTEVMPFWILVSLALTRWHGTTKYSATKVLKLQCVEHMQAY